MKRHLSIGIVIFTLLLLSGQVLAANNPTKTDNTVSVVLDGSTAFDLCALAGVPTPVFLVSIVFKPPAANGFIQVRDGGASGAIIWPTEVSLDGGNRVLYFDGLPRRPYIVGNECSANTIAVFAYSNR